MSDRKRILADLIIVLSAVVLTIGCFCLIPLMHIDSSTDAFIPKHAPVTKTNDSIEEEFGSMDSIILGVNVKFGTVLDPENLDLIRALTDRASQIKSVGHVISLTNAEYIKNSDYGMEVIPLLSGTSPAEISLFKERLTDWQDMYLGTLISTDAKIAAIIIQPEKGAQVIEHEKIYTQLLAMTKEFKNENVSFPIAGLPVIKKEINKSIINDIAFLIPIAAFIILLVLFFSFRRISGVIMPLISLVISASLVVAIMAVFQLTFTMASMLVPVLLLVVGSAYSIHVMSHFYDDMAAQTGFISYSKIRELTNTVIKKVWIPVLLAGLTTAAGFLSNLTSPLDPFRVFGYLSAIGVAFTQITSLIIIPVLLRLQYRNGVHSDAFRKNKKQKKQTKTGGMFLWLEKAVPNGRFPAVIISSMLVIFTLFLVPKIEAGTDMTEFFQPSSSVVKGTKTFNEKLSGSSVLTIMITSSQKSGVLNPIFLSQLDDFSKWVMEQENIGHVQTLVPSIKRINKIMNFTSIPYAMALPKENDSLDLFSSFGETVEVPSPIGAADLNLENDIIATSVPLSREEISTLIAQALLESGPKADVDTFVGKLLSASNYGGESFNEIPLDPAKYGKETVQELQDLISQYLVFYSGNLDMMINDSLEPDKTLITVQLTDESYDTLSHLEKSVAEYWNHYLQDDWTVSIGGGAALSLTLSDLVIQSQIYSLIFALIIVWVMVSIMLKSPIGGLFGMIPVVFSLMGVFISIALFHINLDIVTSLLGSLAIGIGVDYAIHFIDAYKRIISEKQENILKAVYKTTGRAIFINVASVGFGFLSLVISRFVPIQQMGLLFCAAMFFAGISSLTILPIALYHLKPAFLYRQPKTKFLEEKAQ